MKINIYTISICLLLSTSCNQSTDRWIVVERYASGAIKAQNYEDRQSNSIYRQEFYENGNLSLTYTVSNGKINGEFVRYHLNQQVSLKCFMLDNQSHGLWSEYSEDGILVQTTEYYKGIERGFQRFYSNGGSLIKEYYRDGEDVFYFLNIARDSNDQIIEKSEMLKPKFNLPMDSLYFRDTLQVRFEIPLNTPTFDLDSLTLHLAFVKKNTSNPPDYLDSSIFNEFECSGKICLLDFVINTKGENDLVGYYTQIVNGAVKEYQPFSISVNIKNRRD